MRTHPVRLAVAGLSLILLGGFGCSGAGPGTSSDGVAQAQGGPPALPLERLALPPGFEIAVWGRVPGARSLARGDNGTIFVGTREASGGVYALRDNDGDGEADELHTLDEDLFMPNGVAMRDGNLFVAEVNRILRFDGIESRLADPGEPVVVTDDLPDMRHHGWKFIDFGPDGMLYVPVGAPCKPLRVGGSALRLHRPDAARRLGAGGRGARREDVRRVRLAPRDRERCGSLTTTRTGSGTTTRPAR